MEDYDSSSALPLNLISTYAIYIIIAEEDAEEEWRFFAKYTVITLTYSPPCSLL